MAESILKIHTQNGDVPVGYPGLADKPIPDKTLSEEGAFADAKAVGDKFKEVNAETDSLKEDLSNKITKFYASNQGEAHITDSDNGKIQDMMIYGKSSQDGTPTPENPVEIKSVVNPTVKVSNEDGVESKTVTLPYTLNAVPVESGGNVTIDGQQYNSDYIDVKRKKLIRMVKYENISSLDSTKWKFRDDITETNSTRFVDEKKTIDFIFGAKAISNILPFGDANSKNTFRLVPTVGYLYQFNLDKDTFPTIEDWTNYLAINNVYIIYQLSTPQEIDLTQEEVQALKALATYYPTTNISVNSKQLDGYTVFNYPISMANGWNYVKKQLNDNRDYIYDMDIQSAEAYVNSEYAVALTELEV